MSKSAVASPPTGQISSQPPESTNADMFAIAERCLPGAGLGGYALAHDIRLVYSHGLGSRMWDLDGNQYIDYVGGAGALILGHSPAADGSWCAHVRLSHRSRHPARRAAGQRHSLRRKNCLRHHRLRIYWICHAPRPYLHRSRQNPQV